MTVLVDTSVWVDHLRTPDPKLGAMMMAAQVVIHPFVLGELTIGNLRDRSRAVAALAALPSTPVVDSATWLAFVDEHALAGSGIGFVDAHLLVSVAIIDIPLWTRDRRLAERATTLGRLWVE